MFCNLWNYRVCDTDAGVGHILPIDLFYSCSPNPSHSVSCRVLSASLSFACFHCMFILLSFITTSYVPNVPGVMTYGDIPT